MITNIIDLSFPASEFLQIEETILYFTKLHTQTGENEKFSISVQWRGWIKPGLWKKESINTFPEILVLFELLNGKYSFRKDGLQVSLYYRPLWRVKQGNTSLESSAREVFKVASFYSAEMKEDQWKNSFPMKK